MITARTIRGVRISRLGAALLDWRLGGILCLCVALMVLAGQMPLFYAFNVGQERGPGSDLPFLQGFYAPEGTYPSGLFRWSKGYEATITVPGIGRRGVIIGLEILSHRAQWHPDTAPAVLDLQPAAGGAMLITLRPQRAHYLFYLPPYALPDGTLRLHVATPPWQREGDRRDELGIALGQSVTIASVRSPGLTLPDRALLLAWPVCLALLWLALRIMAFPARTALRMLVGLALLLPLLMLLDRPRLGFGSTWAVQAGLIGVLAAAFSAWTVPPLLQRLRVLPPGHLLRWLLLLIVLSFVLKYGGRLYPQAMPGDLQLHVNRYSAMIQGAVYIQAQHRGLPFPFPPALYLLLAPLTLPGFDIAFLFECVAGLLEATTVVLLYILTTGVVGSARLGVLAAATYALTAGGFMVTWFAFETHVAAQWFAILLLVVLALRWPNYGDRPTWWLLVVLLALVFLGHIGLFINTVLLGLLLVALLWWRTNSAGERRGVRCLLSAGLVAGLFAALFYYSGFMELILSQVYGVATQGLNGVTARRPIAPATSLRVLWEGGLITHFGFFPVALALPGTLLIGADRQPRSILPLLLRLTFLVSLSQALLPFLTLSSITTRWLMFSAWAIATTGARGLILVWRRGRSARLMVLAMAGYVCWLTANLWLAAMALRQPPIEPF